MKNRTLYLVHFENLKGNAVSKVVSLDPKKYFVLLDVDGATRYDNTRVPSLITPDREAGFR